MEPGYFDSLGLDDDFGTRRWLTTQAEAWRLMSGGEYECEPLRPTSLESNLRRLIDADNPSSGLLGLIMRTDLSFGAWATARDNEQILDLVTSAIEAGRLVVVRESGQGANDPGAEARAEARRIAREVERLTEGKLHCSGRRYTLCARGQADRAALGETRRMLAPREATTILEAMAAESAARGELAALLIEAKAFFVGDNAEDCDLVLLRHLVQPQARTVDQAPVTPSQIKKDNASWIESVPSDLPRPPAVSNEPALPGVSDQSKHSKVADLRDLAILSDPSKLAQLRSLPDIAKAYTALNTALNIAGLPSLPALPNLPNLPSVPELPALPTLPSVPGLPSLPEIARAHAALNTALNMAGLPTLPNIPNLPRLPALSGLSEASTTLNTGLNAAGLPSLSSLPNLPSVPDLSSLSATSTAVNTALNAAGLPTLPDLPNLPSIPNLPSTSNLPSVAAALSVPGISSVPGVQSVASAAVVVGKAIDSLSAAAAIVHGGDSSSPPHVLPALSPTDPKKKT